MRIILLQLIIIFVSFVSVVNAGWLDPIEVANGSWGSSAGEFQKMESDSGVYTPMGFCVTVAGYIVVGDDFNSRIQVFKPDGTLYSSFSARIGSDSDKKERWPLALECFSNAIYTEYGDITQIYNLSGDLLIALDQLRSGIRGVLSNDSFITENSNGYYKYSSAGKLVNTYKAKPLDLGAVVSEDKLSDGSYKTVIKFVDVTFKLQTPSRITEYYLDTLGYLNVWILAGDDPGHTRVSKYDVYGNLIASMDVPEAEYDQDNPDNEFALVSYSSPVIAPNGDVYVARTGDDYTILKWTWQAEAPRQPQPAVLDVPEYFEVNRASRSIDVEWSPPTQDQTCIIGHEVFRSDAPGGPYAMIAKLEKSNGLYRDEATVAGKVYYYKIRAVCGEKYSEFTKELSRRR